MRLSHIIENKHCVTDAVAGAWRFVGQTGGEQSSSLYKIESAKATEKRCFSLGYEYGQVTPTFVYPIRSLFLAPF